MTAGSCSNWNPSKRSFQGMMENGKMGPNIDTDTEFKGQSILVSCPLCWTLAPLMKFPPLPMNMLCISLCVNAHSCWFTHHSWQRFPILVSMIKCPIFLSLQPCSWSVVFHMGKMEHSKILLMCCDYLIKTWWCIDHSCKCFRPEWQVVLGVWNDVSSHCVWKYAEMRDISDIFCFSYISTCLADTLQVLWISRSGGKTFFSLKIGGGSHQKQRKTWDASQTS